ncbi:MAG: Na/Pi symporter [Candidatus Latescibacterota bacterium]|jgi:phosphate:Na+ symporter
MRDHSNRHLRTAALVLLCLTTITVSTAESVSAGEGHARLVKPAEAGDGQYQSTDKTLPAPLRVRAVTQAGEPVAGVVVSFTVAAVPPRAEGTQLAADTVLTGPDGYAQTALRLGSVPGEYIVAATMPGTGKGNAVVFRATARERGWLLKLIVGLAGGLGLFLFGLRETSNGMKRTAARRVRSVLGRLTDNRFVAMAAGAFVTVLIQSSSVTTVMLVSFVRAGLMTFTQSIGMILGADIGTTITAQLIAIRVTDYALLMVAVGAALILIPKRERLKHIGETILGFGLLFSGMHIMSESMAPIHTLHQVFGLLVALENPLLGIAVGAVFTALIQSSAAFIGILIVLATQGLISLEAGIPLLLGANVGTCVTALLAAIGTPREAKRVALAHVLFKLLGVAIFVWWIPQFAELVRRFSPAGDPGLAGVAHLADVLPRQIANAHTLFNVALTIVMLPFTNVAAALITRLLPDKPGREDLPYRTLHIDRAVLATPVLALNLAKAEVLHMGSVVESMVERIILPFTERNGDIPGDLERDELKVNFLEEQLQEYIGAISRRNLEQERITEVFQMMYSVAELEQIGDIITKNLVPRAREWLKTDLRFSREGRAELIDYHLRTMKQLSRAMNVFQDVNLEAASRMKKKHKKYREMEERYLRSHFDRFLRRVPETLETSEFHQELMEQFRRINSHSTRIARFLLETTEDGMGGGNK